MNLELLVKESEKILLDEFGIIPKKSTYDVHQDWNTFLSKLKTNGRPHGIFHPRTLTANLDANSPYLVSNLLHEYFGHGLYCEHSINGQKIVSYEKQLEALELKMSGLNTLPQNEVLNIPVNHPLVYPYQILQTNAINFLQQTWSQYEGFALWVEQHLADLTGNSNLFMQKIENNSVISDSERQLLSWFKEFENRAGKYAVFYSSNMPKHYNKQKLMEMLHTMYPGQLGEEDLVILYGSQKPYSDIDFFIVSDKIVSYHDEWIDIYAVSHDNFEKRLNLFDISITDPIFSGQALFDSDSKISYYQRLVHATPITVEAIIFNETMSNEQAVLAANSLENTREKKICTSYAQTYRTNAEYLRRGNKPLTLCNMQHKDNF